MNKRASSDDSPRQATRGLRLGTALVLAGVLAASQAQAAFHFWNIREIYTDNSGSLQFIELFCSFGGQNFVGSRQITVTPTGGGMPNTFTIPSNLAGDTTSRAFLFATAAADAAGAPTPDYILPEHFLFPGGGTISFFGANSGPYTAMPTDGVQSRAWGDGNAANSPQNFAGQVGFVVVPEPATWTLLAVSGICLCFLLRRRSP